jgi:hypothetical protein
MALAPSGSVIVSKVNGSDDFIEDILTCEDINAVSTSGNQTISGIKTFINSITLQSDLNVSGSVNLASSALGVVLIPDISNVSGTTVEVFHNLDVVNFYNTANSAVRFPFCVPVLPSQPLNLQLTVIPRTNGQSGNLKFNAEYNIFGAGVSVNTDNYGTLKTTTQSLVVGDYEKVKNISLTIPYSEFTSSGTSPFLVNCKLTRDVSVSGNYAGTASITQIFLEY